MTDQRSTLDSQIRTASKHARGAEHRLAKARRNAARLAYVPAALAEIDDQLRQLEASTSFLDCAYSRAAIERSLRLYLADGDPLTADSHRPDIRDLHGRYPDDGEPEGSDKPKPSWSFHVTSRPRSRNVFGERMSWPARGRKDGNPLPRDGSAQLVRSVRRVDLQRAMRAITRRSAEVSFMRAVLDWRFSDIAAYYGYSEQAAQKAYNKALKELQDVLNGAQEASDVAELLTQRADLERLVAQHRFWLRRASRFESRLPLLRQEVAALEAAARGVNDLTEVAAA